VLLARLVGIGAALGVAVLSTGAITGDGSASTDGLVRSAETVASSALGCVGAAESTGAAAVDTA
jgi:hypothetical protein